MLPSFTVVAILLSLSTLQAGQQPANNKTITMVTADGCVDGRELKMARPASIDDAELIVSPVHRLSGSAQIKTQNKGLNRRPVRVRGELSELPGSAAASTMVGKTRVTIGHGPDDPLAPTVTRAPEPPAIEVQAITALEGTCGASHAPSTNSQPAPVESVASKSEGATAASGHYMYAWVGDTARKGNDFL